MKWSIKLFVKFAAATIFILPLLIAALIAKCKRRKNFMPRVVLGPVPIISLKYIAAALKLKGYIAVTCVYGFYKINRREDFDYFPEDLSPTLKWFPESIRNKVIKVMGPYLVFMRLLVRYDCIITFFDGGFLASTILQRSELWLLRFAGCKSIVMPYGGDCAVPSMIKSMAWRHGLAVNYPDIGRNEAKIHRRVQWFCRNADYIVGCVFHWESLAIWHIMPTHYYPLPIDEWSMPEVVYDNAHPVIIHSPNHRAMKGTEFLIKASKELLAEGVKHELVLVENMTNEMVKQALKKADILVEQLINGYALSAMEGMALGKVVISNISDDYYYSQHRMHTGLDECPIVSATPETIKDVIKTLILASQEERIKIGEAGRIYMQKFHSLESCGQMWDSILKHLFQGLASPPAWWHPGRM